MLDGIGIASGQISTGKGLAFDSSVAATEVSVAKFCAVGTRKFELASPGATDPIGVTAAGESRSAPSVFVGFGFR